MIDKDYQLTLNLLNFSHKHEKLTACITTESSARSTKLSQRDAEWLVKQLKLPADTPALYTTFDENVPGGIEITLATSPGIGKEDEKCWSLSFLKKFYSHQLAEYFLLQGLTIKHDFVSDTEVWVKETSPFPNCQGYRVFTLRVQFSRVTKQPELMIMAGEIRSVVNKPVSDDVFSKTPDENFNWVIYKKHAYRFRFLPDEARRHLEEVYPCVGSGLMLVLGLKKPAPDKGNRYKKYWNEIEQFKNDYLLKESFREYLHLDKDWIKVIPEQLNMQKFKPVQFGEGEHIQPKFGMKMYGPKHLVPHRSVVFFFIVHKNDVGMAFTINDYLTGIKSEFKGGLNNYVQLPYKTEDNLSITFLNKDNPLPEIEEKLGNRTFDANKRYVAIYLSPHSKWAINQRHKEIYYQIKETLLNRGIVSQTIEVEKTWNSGRKVDEKGRAILNSNFQYCLPNIAVAILAKLGGTPWSLEKPATNELVIGISAYRCRDLDKKYLGSAFSFTNEGRFQGFECFRNNQIVELAGSILFAVKEYCKAHTSLERLVIHFYKNLSWKELKPIEKGLSELGLKVPLLVVSVNKSYSDDIVGFHLTPENKMPLTGTFLPIGRSQYLLYNNQLTPSAELNDREGYPFPLKITLQKYAPQSKESTEPDSDERTALLDQVCRFSQLYWKSVSRQWMPVTLKYPEMLAQMVPHFKHSDLPAMGKESLWFL